MPPTFPNRWRKTLGTRAAPILAAWFTMLALPACATVFSGSSAKLRIHSDIPGSQVRIVDHRGLPVFTGSTPCTVRLARGRAFFRGAEYLVEVHSAGHPPRVERVATEINEWYYGNAVLPGGLLGSLLIDPWTGAMFEFDRSDVTVSFARAPGGDASR